MKKNSKINVSIIMGSQSDYSTMKYAEKTLKSLGIKFEKKILMLLLQVLEVQHICQEW